MVRERPEEAEFLTVAEFARKAVAVLSNLSPNERIPATILGIKKRCRI
jgi:hypothetical protein